MYFKENCVRRTVAITSIAFWAYLFSHITILFVGRQVPMHVRIFFMQKMICTAVRALE